MRLEGRRESDNVIDSRRSGGGLMVGGGGIATLIILALAWFFNVDPRPLLQNMPQGGAIGVQDEREIDPADDPQAPLVRFSKIILADTEDTWSQLFEQHVGKQYQPAPLHLFAGGVRSACGNASSATGPFYCPSDQQVYIDLDFFEEMKTKFNAPGDFAMAYVIAHEVGHHVQNLLGLSRQVQEQQAQLASRGRETEANRLSVRVELQADYLAGVWAHHAEKRQPFLEDGDIEEALNAAQQIGDDRLQKRAQGYVVPDAFTHGTSEQRARWFRRGFRSGNFEDMQQLFDADYEQL